MILLFDGVGTCFRSVALAVNFLCREVAGAHDFIYPVKIFNKEEKSKLKPFSFFGPTCDSNDFMRGPFLLPESINEGDYLQIEEMGAYSLSMKNNFNGFFSTPKIFIDEEK